MRPKSEAMSSRRGIRPDFEAHRIGWRQVGEEALDGAGFVDIAAGQADGFSGSSRAQVRRACAGALGEVPRCFQPDEKARERQRRGRHEPGGVLINDKIILQNDHRLHAKGEEALDIAPAAKLHEGDGPLQGNAADFLPFGPSHVDEGAAEPIHRGKRGHGAVWPEGVDGPGFPTEGKGRRGFPQSRIEPPVERSGRGHGRTQGADKLDAVRLERADALLNVMVDGGSARRRRRCGGCRCWAGREREVRRWRSRRRSARVASVTSERPATESPSSICNCCRCAGERRPRDLLVEVSARRGRQPPCSARGGTPGKGMGEGTGASVKGRNIGGELTEGTAEVARRIREAGVEVGEEVERVPEEDADHRTHDEADKEGLGAPPPPPPPPCKNSCRRI